MRPSVFRRQNFSRRILPSWNQTSIEDTRNPLKTKCPSNLKLPPTRRIKRFYLLHIVFERVGSVPNSPGGNQNTLHTYGGNIDTDNLPEYNGMR